MPKKEGTTTQKSGKQHSGKLVYEQIRYEILTLKLKPSTQLDEISLAARFKLSRSPVRDALARLVAEGLATNLPNRTTIVTPFNIEDFPQYISALDLLQRSVTRLAAINRTEDDLQEIKRINQIYVTTLLKKDYQEMFSLNRQFHMQIAKASGNTYLAEYYGKLLEEGQRLLYLQFDYISNLALPLEADHDEMIKSIELKDADAAEAAAHQHTLLFQARFLDYMSQNLTQHMKTSTL